MSARTLAVLTAAGLCATLALAQTRKTDRERAELVGPVKSVLTEMEEEGAGPNGRVVYRRFISSASYDRSGQLIEDAVNMADFTRKRTPERVDANTTRFRSAMGASVEHYTFDASGNIASTTIVNGDEPDGSRSTSRYKYDAQRHLVEDDMVDDDGTVHSYVLYTRDAKGVLVKQENCLNDTRPPCATVEYSYRFDARGNWIWRSETASHVPPEDAYMYRDQLPLVRTIMYYE